MLRAVKISEHVFVFAWPCAACTTNCSNASLQHNLGVHLERGHVGLTKQTRCCSRDDPELPERAAIGLLYTPWVGSCCDFHDAQRVCAFEPRHGERPNHFKPGGVGSLVFRSDTPAAAPAGMRAGVLPVLVHCFTCCSVLVTGMCGRMLSCS